MTIIGRTSRNPIQPPSKNLHLMSHAEFQLLLACIRARLAGGPIDSDSVEWSKLDWTEVVSLALRHKIAPLVNSFQGDLRGITPLESTRLNRRCRSILAKNLELARQLQSIHETLLGADIPLMAIKGPTLAIEIHGGLQHRQFSDLDVLIRPDDLAQTLQLSMQLGYRVDGPAVHQLSESRLRKFAARSRELTLVRHDGNRTTAVDLHWGLSDDPHFFETDHSALFASDSSCSIGGSAVCTAPFEFQLVYLALHAIGHQCARLSWLFDFAVALNRLTAVETQDFLQGLIYSHRRIVICAMLMLERLELIENIDAVVKDGAKWRRTFASMIQAMIDSATRQDAKLLLGSYANGVWKWQLTGRIRPFINSLAMAVVPAEQDWLAPGWYGPYVSRMKCLSANTARLISGFLRTQEEPAVVEEAVTSKVLKFENPSAIKIQDQNSRAA